MDDKNNNASLNKGALNAAEIAAMTPAVLFCAVTLLMLILDIALPSMEHAQYVVYPVMIKIAGLAGLIAAAACFKYDLYSDRLRPDAPAVLFMIFLGCVVISTCINGLTQDVLFGISYRYVGIFDLAVFFSSYMYCSSRISAASHKRLVMLAFTVISDIVAAAFIINEMIGCIAAFQGRMEPGGMFFHGNHYGYYLVMAVVVSISFVIFESGSGMVLGLFSLIINLIALIICRSMGAVLACAAAAAVMLIWVLIKESAAEKKRAKLLVLIFAAAAIAALTMGGRFRNDLVRVFDESAEIASGSNNVYAGNGRWGLWQFTLIYISEKPLFGFGCEGITERLFELTKIPNPHNELLTYAAWFGVPAAVMYAFGTVLRLARSLKADAADRTEATAAFAALGYFISSLFGVAMFYTAPLFFIMMGLSCASISDTAAD